MRMMGMPVVFSTTALKETTERLFPASKHRSRRIHKKLIKRFGGEFRKEPCIWKIGDRIVAHPSYEEAFRKAAGAGRDQCATSF